jgi:methionyl aminopeptidase
VKAGGSALDLVRAIERIILSRGAHCAFPVNIGINEVAAHYTPTSRNDVKFKTGDVVKVDVGAHIDGYPADTAATVEVGTRNHRDLISAADDALNMAIEMVAPGTRVSAIGETVESTMTASGFRPVENLVGHSMERFSLHAGLSVPSIRNRDRTVLEEDMIIAIEPFSTNGRGMVDSSGRGDIYRVVRDRRAPAEISNFFSRMQSTFGGFPFAGRWCENLHPNASTFVPKLVRMGMIMNYQVLSEVEGGVVAQMEHSVLVTKDGCEVLTRQ